MKMIVTNNRTTILLGITIRGGPSLTVPEFLNYNDITLKTSECPPHVFPAIHIAWLSLWWGSKRKVLSKDV